MTQHVDLSTTGVKIVYSAGAQPSESPLVPIEKLRQRLLDVYRRNTKLPTLFSNVEVSVGDLYIPLAMLDDKTLTEQQKQGEKSTQPYQAKEDKHLKWDELFYDKEKKQPLQRVIVRGLAGSGKTTLSRRIAWEWCQHQNRGEPLLNRFDWVFWVPLRDLQTCLSCNQLSPGKLIYECHFAKYALADDQGNKFTQDDMIQAIDKLIFQQGLKTLWLLDGYDELNRNQLEEFNVCLRQLLEGRKATILLTSRPSAKIPTLLLEDRQVTTRGFTWLELQKYILKFYKRQSNALSQWQTLAQRLTAFFKQHPPLQQLGFTPINAELICHLWQNRQGQANDFKKKQLKRATLTSLYTAVMEYLLRRHLDFCHASQKNNEWEVNGRKYLYDEENRGLWTSNMVFEVNAELLQACESLAFISFAQHEGKAKDIVIRPNVFMEAMRLMSIHEVTMGEHLKSLCRIGLLHPTSDVIKQDLIKNHYAAVSNASINYLEHQYEFMHLSFHEMFAGRYIARKWTKEYLSPNGDGNSSIRKYVSENKRHPNLNAVWIYSVGQLRAMNCSSRRINVSVQVLSYLEMLFESPYDLGQFNDVALLLMCCNEVLHELPRRNRAALLSYLGEYWKAITLRQYWENPFVLAVRSSMSILREELFFQPIVALLDSDDDKKKRNALTALGRQPFLPESIMQILIKKIACESNYFQCCIVSIFEMQSLTSDKVYEAVFNLLKAQDSDVCFAALKVISKNSGKLNEEELHVLLDLFRNQSVKIDKEDAKNILEKQDEIVLADISNRVNSNDPSTENILCSIQRQLRNTPEQHRKAKLYQICAESQFQKEDVSNFIGCFNGYIFKHHMLAIHMLLSDSNLSNEIFEEMIGTLSWFAIRENVEWYYRLYRETDINPKTAKKLINAISRKNSFCRNIAGQLLWLDSTLGSSIVIKIFELLDNPVQDEVYMLLSILWKQKSFSSSVAPYLYRLLENHDRNIIYHATCMLEKVENVNSEHIDVLTKLMGSNEAWLRKSVLQMLIRKPQVAKKVYAGISALLDDEDLEVQKESLHILSKLKDKMDPEVVNKIQVELWKKVELRNSIANLLSSQKFKEEKHVLWLVQNVDGSKMHTKSVLLEALAMNMHFGSALSVIECYLDVNNKFSSSILNKLKENKIPSEAIHYKLLNLLQHPSTIIRHDAARILLLSKSLSSTTLQDLSEILTKDLDLVKELMSRQSPPFEVFPDVLCDAVLKFISGGECDGSSRLQLASLIGMCETIAIDEARRGYIKAIIQSESELLGNGMSTRLTLDLLCKANIMLDAIRFCVEFASCDSGGLKYFYLLAAIAFSSKLPVYLNTNTCKIYFYHEAKTLDISLSEDESRALKNGVDEFYISHGFKSIEASLFRGNDNDEQDTIHELK